MVSESLTQQEKMLSIAVEKNVRKYKNTCNIKTLPITGNSFGMLYGINY